MTRISNKFSPSKFFLKKVDLSTHEINDIRQIKITRSQIHKILNSQNINDYTSEKILTTSLHSVYKIKSNKVTIILRINPSKRIEHQFLVDSIVPQITNNGQKKYHVDLSRKIVPFDFEMIWIIPGKDLYNDTRLGTLSMNNLTKAGHKLFLLHQNAGKHFGPLNINILHEEKKLVGTVDSWSEFIYRNLKMHISYCKNNKLINSLQAKKISEVFDQNKEFIKCVRKNSLVHGDVSHPNMYITAKGILYIDFEDCFLGDPYYDLAFYASGCFGNEKWFDAFLKGYTKNNKLDDDFLKRFNLYYLRAVLIKTISRHKYQKSRKVSLFDFTKRIDYALSKFY